MSDIILPGKRTPSTEHFTSTDFERDIKANNIKSTFLDTAQELELPLIYLDFIDSDPPLRIAYDAFKRLLLTREYIEGVKEEGRDIHIVTVYMKNVTNQNLVKIGVVEEEVAYKVIPDFVKDAFPKKTKLMLSEDGKTEKDMKAGLSAKIKLRFEE